MNKTRRHTNCPYENKNKLTVFDNLANHRLRRGDSLGGSRDLNRPFIPLHVQLGVRGGLDVLDHVATLADDPALAAHARDLDHGFSAAAAVAAVIAHTADSHVHHRLRRAHGHAVPLLLLLLLLHAVPHLRRAHRRLLRVSTTGWAAHRLLRHPVRLERLRGSAAETSSLRTENVRAALRAKPVANLPLTRLGSLRGERIGRQRHDLQHDPPG